MTEESASIDGDDSLVFVHDAAEAGSNNADDLSNADDRVSELRPGSASSTGVGLKLDVTLVLTAALGDDKAQKPELPLFSMVSINPETAPTVEVPWSQLLALSLAHEDGEQPALTVGRHKDCNLRIKDPRCSVHHFNIIARKKRVDEDSELGPITYDCVLNDSSSNGTMVNGRIVGRGGICSLCSGDEVCVLTASKVGVDNAISWIFRNSTEILARGVAEERGPPSHIRSEDITDFQEPILRKMPTEPTVAAEPFPTNPFYRPPMGTSMLADLLDPSLRTSLRTSKMELVGVLHTLFSADYLYLWCT